MTETATMSTETTTTVAGSARRAFYRRIFGPEFEIWPWKLMMNGWLWKGRHPLGF